MTGEVSRASLSSKLQSLAKLRLVSLQSPGSYFRQVWLSLLSGFSLVDHSLAKLVGWAVFGFKETLNPGPLRQLVLRREIMTLISIFNHES